MDSKYFYLKLSLISILSFGGLYAKETPNFILVLTDDQGWTSFCNDGSEAP